MSHLLLMFEKPDGNVTILRGRISYASPQSSAFGQGVAGCAWHDVSTTFYQSLPFSTFHAPFSSSLSAANFAGDDLQLLFRFTFWDSTMKEINMLQYIFNKSTCVDEVFNQGKSS